MAWVLEWLFGFLPPPGESEEQIAEQEDLQREQQQINLIARRGEKVLETISDLPPLQRQRSGVVLPCVFCPTSPSLVSPVCPGQSRWSPTWEQAEGALILLVLNLLLWGVLWAAFGAAAGPLSAPFYVIMLALSGSALGQLVSSVTPLPPLYGMLILPAIAGNLDIKELEVLADLRGDVGAVIVFASVGVFFARAGIDVDLMTLQSSSGLVLALAFLPLFAETAMITLSAAYILDIPWRWAFVLGSLTAPMSPLVVMWSALRLQSVGLGLSTAVSSLLLVVCALDSATSLSLLGVAIQCAKDAESWFTIADSLAQLPCGILLGAVVGFFAIYVPNEHSVHATFYRVEMMLAVNICSVIVFHYCLERPAIGYLSAFTTACVATNGWKTLSMDSKKETLRTMMSLSWLILQPVAMSIIGPHIVLARIADWRRMRYIGVFFMGVMTRLAVSLLCCLKSKRQWSEKCFICIASTPKGTAQLVTCSWTLLHVFSTTEDQAMANLVADCCVLALLTGPIATLISSTLAPVLLRKEETA